MKIHDKLNFGFLSGTCSIQFHGQIDLKVGDVVKCQIGGRDVHLVVDHSTWSGVGTEGGELKIFQTSVNAQLCLPDVFPPVSVVKA
jgi:hypothetical protein